MYELLLIFVLVATLTYINWSRKTKNLPPGPTGWFGLRSLVEMMRADPVYPHNAMKILAEKYGDIMSVDLGVNPAVMFSKYEDMLEIFVKDEFTPRYRFNYMEERSYHKELGILTTSFDPWHSIRKFSTKSLRDFGMRRSEVLGNLLREEFESFSETFSKAAEENGGIVNFDANFTMTVVKVILNFILGFRSKECDDLLKRFLDKMDDFIKAFAFDNINILYPIIGKLLPEFSGFNRDKKLFKVHQDIFQEIISESKKHHIQHGSTPFNFIEAFQNEIDKTSGNPNSHFTDDQLLMFLVDLFLAGSETTSHFLGFAMLHLLRNPEMQEKIYTEICTVVPEDTKEIPCYADGEKMPYTQAFISEVFRYCNIVPIPLARRTAVDFTYKGFFIPKGVCVMYNLHVVFTDPAYWGDPQNFRPERFIDPSTGKLTKTERLIMFGIGKRFCPGDIMARQTAFAFLTGMVKNFKIAQVPGQNMPTDTPRSSFTSKPYPFQALVTRRQHFN